MAEDQKQDDYPEAWFNPDFRSEINYYHPETGVLVDEWMDQALEEQAAAARAREAHPDRVEAFLENRRALILADQQNAGGTLWDMVLSNTQDWTAAELADAGVAPSENAATRFYEGFMEGTPGLDLSGVGAGFLERARKTLPEMPHEAPGRLARKAFAKRALGAADADEGHYLAGYLARTEFEERQAYQPGTLASNWRKIVDEQDGSLAAASLQNPTVIAEALRQFVGHAFEQGTLEGISVPLADDAAMRRVVAKLRKSRDLPREVRVELAAADGALAGGRSDPAKLFATFVHAGEALRPMDRDPYVQECPEDTLVYAAGYATGQAMHRASVRERDIKFRSEDISIH